MTVLSRFSESMSKEFWANVRDKHWDGGMWRKKTWENPFMEIHLFLLISYIQATFKAPLEYLGTPNRLCRHLYSRSVGSFRSYSKKHSECLNIWCMLGVKEADVTLWEHFTYREQKTKKKKMIRTKVKDWLLFKSPFSRTFTHMEEHKTFSYGLFAPFWSQQQFNTLDLFVFTPVLNAVHAIFQRSGTFFFFFNHPHCDSVWFLSDDK